MYVLGLALMIGSVLWQTPFTGGTNDDQLDKALYATLSFPLFTVGLLLLVYPALIGKAALFRFWFGSQSWTMAAQIAPGMFYAVPLVAVPYFLASQHQVQITYLMLL